MKKKRESAKLVLDKDTMARLSIDVLSADNSREVFGGAATTTVEGPTCCGPYKYTSCA
jgi:hypothetical protein